MKRNRESYRLVLRPWLAGWELWKIPPGVTATATLVNSSIVPSPARHETDLVAVPARSVVSAAFWVPVPDSGEWREAAQLETELRGLMPARNAETAVCLRKLSGDEARTLVRAVVFPVDLTSELSGLGYRHFEASPLLIPLAPDSANLWNENGELVLCITRGDSVIAWETLEALSTPEEVRAWIRLFLIQLHAEGVVSEIRSWYDFTATFQDRDRILPEGASFSTPGPIEPILPTELSTWKPASAISVIQRADRTRQIQGILKYAAIAYLILLAGALGFIGALKLKLSAETSKRDRLSEEVERFAPTSRAWQAVASTVETSQFPLEILHKLVKNLPPTGIRLTLMDMSGENVIVEGEATSISLPAGFLAALESDADFSEVTWEMAPPSLLPNNTARFQMRGTIPTP